MQNDDFHGEKYTLVIGIENYPKSSGLEPAKYAVNDALAIADYARQAGFNHLEGSPLLDEQATYANVLSRLELLFNYAGPDDFVLLFYAGHSHLTDNGGFLVPADYRSGSDVNESSCISFDTINKRFRKKKEEKVKRLLVFLDTCHAGLAGDQVNIRAGTQSQPPLPPKARKKIEKQMDAIVQINDRGIDTVRVENEEPEVARVVFAASGTLEKSQACDDLKHGIFTHYLLSALKSRDGDNSIDIEQIIPTVKHAVIEYCVDNGLKMQKPHAFTKIHGVFRIPSLMKTSR